MKIIERNLTEKVQEERYGDFLEIEIDGKIVFSVYDGEPEDNSLSRNFNDCYSITRLIQDAFDAGRSGESFEIIYEEVNEI